MPFDLSAAASGPMTEEQKAERKTLIVNNKAWASAEVVRREWLAEFLSQKPPPKDTGKVIAQGVTMHRTAVGSAVSNGSVLATLSAHLESELTNLGVTGGLTIAHITSDNRAITTLIAGWLRDTLTLFDGTQPLGIRFTSKHGHPAGGTGTCWAYWIRATDVGLDEPINIIGETAIAERDADLKTAQAFCKIQTR
ncbi:MAG: hypothetical protein JJE28_08200 [Actinomycetales bacterium]|nr:hypothetical protein [Actinomycetales bacterium]